MALGLIDGPRIVWRKLVQVERSEAERPAAMALGSGVNDLLAAMREPFPRENQMGITGMRKGAIHDLRQAAELIDKCEVDHRPDQAELEEMSSRLRDLAQRLSAEAVLKVAEV